MIFYFSPVLKVAHLYVNKVWGIIVLTLTHPITNTNYRDMSQIILVDFGMHYCGLIYDGQWYEILHIITNYCRKVRRHIEANK